MRHTFLAPHASLITKAAKELVEGFHSNHETFALDAAYPCPSDRTCVIAAQAFDPGLCVRSRGTREMAISDRRHWFCIAGERVGLLVGNYHG